MLAHAVLFDGALNKLVLFVPFQPQHGVAPGALFGEAAVFVVLVALVFKDEQPVVLHEATRFPSYPRVEQVGRLVVGMLFVGGGDLSCLDGSGAEDAACGVVTEGKFPKHAVAAPGKFAIGIVLVAFVQPVGCGGVADERLVYAGKDARERVVLGAQA